MTIILCEDREEGFPLWRRSCKRFEIPGMGKSAEEATDQIELTFAPAVHSVTAANWLDGRPGPLKLVRGKASLRVQGVAAGAWRHRCPPADEITGGGLSGRPMVIRGA